ncbi:MAG: hypothetical protein K6F14_07225 [Clostridiales bacterium]|nr:hypothetical protein [Clostridiales bacterium]
MNTENEEKKFEVESANTLLTRLDGLYSKNNQSKKTEPEKPKTETKTDDSDILKDLSALLEKSDDSYVNGEQKKEEPSEQVEEPKEVKPEPKKRTQTKRPAKKTVSSESSSVIVDEKTNKLEFNMEIADVKQDEYVPEDEPVTETSEDVDRYVELYDKYLGEKNEEELKQDSSFAALQKKIFDLQTSSGYKTEEPAKDVNEIIDEAELYVNTAETKKIEEDKKREEEISMQDTSVFAKEEIEPAVEEENTEEEQVFEEPSQDDAGVPEEEKDEKAPREFNTTDDIKLPDDDSFWTGLDVGEVKEKEARNINEAIDEAQQYVDENYKGRSNEAPNVVIENIDNYSTGQRDKVKPKKDKKILFSLLHKEEEPVEDDYEQITFVSEPEEDKSEREDTRIYMKDAFTKEDEKEEVVIEQTPVEEEKVETEEEEVVSEEVEEKKAEPILVEEDPDSADTAIMMMAFGYDTSSNKKPSEPVEKNYDEYRLSGEEEESKEFNVASISEETTTSEMDATKTSQMDSEAKMEIEEKYELTTSEKSKKVFIELKKKAKATKLKMYACILIALALLLVESVLPLLGVVIADSSVMAMIDWGLTFLCIILVLDCIIAGARQIASFKLDVDSALLLMLVFALVSSFAGAFSTAEGIKLYNLSFAVCAVFDLMSNSFKLSKDIYSFKVISSAKTKRALVVAEGTDKSLEEQQFANYLNKTSDVYKVKNVRHVANFFENKNEIPKSKNILKYMIPAVFAIAIIAFIISLVRGAEFLGAINNAYLMYAFCTPVSFFISFSYPAFRSSMRAYNSGAAILNDTTPETYANAAVITFKDIEAFPADKIKLKSIKIYNNAKFENVIYYASSLFSKLGGPMSKVFFSATLDSKISEDIEIREISQKGVDAMVDGKHIVVGQPEYMDNQCFELYPEITDNGYSDNTNRRILYLACDEVVFAKFYIQYNTSKDFIYMVRRLYQDGLCVAIKTSDPCIDDGVLVKNRLNPNDYAIRIIKGSNENVDENVVSTTKTGIVTTGSVKGLIKALLLCDKISNITRTNLIIKLVSAGIGAIVMGILIFAGVSGNMWSLYPALYELFWSIPLILVSVIYL